MLIGVIVCGIVEDYAVNLCQSIEHISEKNDVKCVVIPIRFIGLDYETILGNKYAYCYNSMVSYGLLSCFDGLIIEMASVLMYAEDERKKRFAQLFDNIPHVFISFDKENTNNVALDNQAGLTEALEYMYKNGAKKFVMLGGTPGNIDAIDRKDCFEKFIRKHNLSYSDKTYKDASFFLPCDEDAEQLLLDNMDADVIVCANDVLAKTIYKTCRKVGKKPGKDVSVLGFDDSRICTTIYPAISSIRTDIVELGKESFHLLMDAIKGAPSRKVVVPSKFILRDSICHREHGKEELFINLTFKDVLLQSDNNPYIDKIEKILSVVADLINHPKSRSLDSILQDIYLNLDELFSFDNLDCINWERFFNVTNLKYKQWVSLCTNPDEQKKITALFVKLYEMMLIHRNTAPNKSVHDFMRNMEMEQYFRESMQYVRNSEANYTRFIKSSGFMGIQNAYLYIYDEPIYYIQGELLKIPEYLNLKVVMKDGKTIPIPLNKQKIHRESVFINKYVNWMTYSNLMAFPVYSDNIIFGILVCDMKRVGYEKADLFIHQLGSSIRMMNLRIENKRIVDNYEDSVRRLKEHNITLDTMSKTDPLTGLNNRRGFNMRSHTLFGLFPNDSLSVIIGYLDMNDLKVVNDRFGHDDGDYALKTIGNILADFVTTHNG